MEVILTYRWHFRVLRKCFHLIWIYYAEGNAIVGTVCQFYVININSAMKWQCSAFLAAGVLLLGSENRFPVRPSPLLGMSFLPIEAQCLHLWPSLPPLLLGCFENHVPLPKWIVTTGRVLGNHSAQTFYATNEDHRVSVPCPSSELLTDIGGNRTDVSQYQLPSSSAFPGPFSLVVYKNSVGFSMIVLL